MAVREATTDDVDAIREVARRSWEQDYPDVLSRESIREGVGEWYSPELVRDSIVWSQALLLVADRDDEVVGFAHAIWEPDDESAHGEGGEGHLLRVYVDPAHRGEGIGGQLLETTVDRLFDRGVDRVKSMVLEENDLGNKFYQSFGFERESTEEISIGDERYTECTYVVRPD
ncbi:GNAT family N-acetyltransferase [Natronobacterium texcoconense]|uniref:Ribosomal protein S18 acetylase RimI n=1 Tax=Natronobacterium texcoconense TaxID=1095778 RepID=A0A1H1HXX7_NATTX|nr:GNAT family N-acetyltransferase [Natronobacterium texcoconense]SDR30149.1 Ribosomal protein S18 acetylase RimI [Natronobacterium texcoconense]